MIAIHNAKFPADRVRLRAERGDRLETRAAYEVRWVYKVGIGDRRAETDRAGGRAARSGARFVRGLPRGDRPGGRWRDDHFDDRRIATRAEPAARSCTFHANVVRKPNWHDPEIRSASGAGHERPHDADEHAGRAGRRSGSLRRARPRHRPGKSRRRASRRSRGKTRRSCSSSRVRPRRHRLAPPCAVSHHACHRDSQRRDR